MTSVKVCFTNEKVTGVIMFVTMNKNFVEWLDLQLRERKWSPSELARNSGVSQSAISLVLKGDRNPGNNFCDGIAKAFNIPPDDVYRIAGLLPMKPNDDQTVSEITHIYHELTDENRDDLLDYARLRLQKQERDKNGKPARTTSHRQST